jgi:hypothetical protein
VDARSYYKIVIYCPLQNCNESGQATYRLRFAGALASTKGHDEAAAVVRSGAY